MKIYQLSAYAPKANERCPMNNEASGFRGWKIVCALTIFSLLFAGSVFAQTNYYSKSTGNLNSTATWGLNTDGTGASPSNFTANNQVFNIRNNATPTISASWTVSGTNSKIIVGNGTNACNFTVGSNFVLNAAVDVSANGTITLSTTGSITSINFGTLAATSTVNFASTSSQTIPNETWGNIIISGSKGNNDVTFAAGVTIAGSLTITATGNSGQGFVFFNTNNQDRNFSISGDYIQSGAIDVEFGSGNGHSYITLGGNFSKTAGYMVTTGNTENGRFTMTGANVTMQSNGGTEIKWMDFIIANGSVCTLNGQFNYFGSNGTNAIFTVNSGGTMNCGTFNFVSTGGFAQFINNGTLGIGSAAGITSSGSSGNVQTTTRTFNTGGTYVYNGTTQATGSGLPTVAITGGVTISNGATVTSTNAIIVNTPGVLAVNGILIPGSATQVMSGSGTLNGSGTVQVNRTAATAGFLNQYTQTTKTLTNLTVEYTVLTGAQVVSSAIYNNLKLNNTSGTNTTGGNVTVNGTLTTTAGGTLNLGTNQLLGTLSTVTNGGTIQTQNTSATPVPTGKTWGGTVQYNATTGGQTVMAGTYNNLTLSNTSNTQTASGSITVNATLTTTAGGAFAIGSNILTLNAAVVGAGTLTGSNTSELVIGGTAGTLNFTAGGSNNFLKNFTLNTGATASLGNALNITAYDGTSSEGVLTVTGTATLTTGGFLTLKSNANGTARVAAGRTTGGYISGDVTVERFIPQNSRKAWRLLASTTSGQTINAAWQEGAVGDGVNPNAGFGTIITGRTATFGTLSAANAAGYDALSAGHGLLKYNPATDNLDPVPNTNSTGLASEQGYFVFVRGNRQSGSLDVGLPTAPSTSTVLRSKGTLFTGDQSAVATGAQGWGLVRNPYPSRIDMRSISRSGGLIDAFQVWDPKVNTTGIYQTFTKNTGTGNYEVSPGGGSYGANGSVQNFIESGLAFFIQGPAGETATVTEACKTSGSQVAFRPASGASGGEQKRLLFNVYALNGTSTDMVDGGYIDFNEVYSNNVDVNDVKKSPNFGENFGIQRNGTDLVVERRSGLTAHDTIPFRMYQLRTISYRIDLQHTGLDPQTTKVILEDQYTGTRTELNSTGTTAYTFTVTATAATRAQDRFRLILSNTNTFTGAGNWTDASRWSLGYVPAGNEEFSIGAGADAVLNTDLELTGTLTMGDGSRLTVAPGRTLTVAAGGTADFKEQSVVFKSDATGYGSLGQVTGTLTGASNITVERYIPNNGFRSWRLLSVPTYGTQTIRQAWQENNAPMVNGKPGYGTLITGGGNSTAAAQAAGFDYSGGNASMLTWNGTGWSNISGTLAPVSAHNAYFLYVRGDRSKGVTGQTTDANATTLRTTGNVYTGDQSYSIAAGQFAVVPNPYASAIDFTQLQRSGVANTYYVWDSKKQNGNQLGAYQTFAAPDYECLLGGGSYVLGSLNNTVIESGQAFLVRGITGGTLTVKESAKRAGSATGNLGLRPVGAVRKLKAGLYAEGEMLDAAQVRFGTAFTNAVNEEDADKLGNPGVNLAVEQDQRLLAVEGRAEPGAGETVIRYRMWNLKPGTYRLELEEKDLLAEGLEGEVRDSYTGQVTPLQATGTTKLNFTVNGDAASAAPNRFTVVLKRAGKLQPAGWSVAPNPVEGRQMKLNLVLPAGNYTLRMTDPAGRLVLVRSLSHAGGTQQHTVNLPSKLTSGNYQVELQSADRSGSVQQIFVN